MGVNLILFPAIDPIALQIGPIAIRWYGLAYLTGFLFAWFYMVKIIGNKTLHYRKKPPIKKNMIPDLVLWGAFGVFIGGRLGHVLFYDLAYYLQFPLEIIMIHKGGMSFHGGTLGAFGGTLLFCRKKHLKPLPIIDLLALTAPIGLCLGRIANFINGELWGKPTAMPWGVVFPHVDNLARHPSQIYEALLEGIILFLILRHLAHRYKMLTHPGAIAGIFGCLYGSARIGVEFFREPDAHIGYWIGPITTGMILSLPMILIGAMLLKQAFKKRTRK